MPTLPTLPIPRTPYPAADNIYGYYYTRQLASLIRKVRGAQASRDEAPAADYVSLPNFQYNWARFPAMPPAGETRDLLKLPDETLTYYAEQYLLYVAPWEHLVGTLIPNFYQFIAWHEHIALPSPGPIDETTAAGRASEFDDDFIPAGVARESGGPGLSPEKTLFQSARLQARKMFEFIH